MSEPGAANGNGGPVVPGDASVLAMLDDVAIAREITARTTSNEAVSGTLEEFLESAGFDAEGIRHLQMRHPRRSGRSD